MDLWDLLYIHTPRDSLERVVAIIACHRTRAVVTIPSSEIEDAKDAPWVHNLRCMTLINTQLPSAGTSSWTPKETRCHRRPAKC